MSAYKSAGASLHRGLSGEEFNHLVSRRSHSTAVGKRNDSYLKMTTAKLDDSSNDPYEPNTWKIQKRYLDQAWTCSPCPLTPPRGDEAAIRIHTLPLSPNPRQRKNRIKSPRNHRQKGSISAKLNVTFTSPSDIYGLASLCIPAIHMPSA